MSTPTHKHQQIEWGRSCETHHPPKNILWMGWDVKGWVPVSPFQSKEGVVGGRIEGEQKGWIMGEKR
eukprot:765147-Hanusia_phi.AAC.2